MKNKFGHTIKKGMTVSCSHPRGGRFTGTVESFETLRHPDKDTREFVRAYGPCVILTGGSSVAIDDCTPV